MCPVTVQERRGEHRPRRVRRTDAGALAVDGDLEACETDLRLIEGVRRGLGCIRGESPPDDRRVVQVDELEVERCPGVDGEAVACGYQDPTTDMGDLTVVGSWKRS